jgi:hypothetical protein
MVVKRRIRFKATAARTGETITAAAFLDLYCTTPTAITGFQLANACRIRSIELWGPMAADLVPVTVIAEYNGLTPGLFGNSLRASDTSIGSTSSAHVKLVPTGLQEGMWFASGAQIVATLSYPLNTIVDVVVEIALVDNAAAVAVTGAVAGATIGASYTRALNSPTDNNLVPQGLSTI